MSWLRVGLWVGGGTRDLLGSAADVAAVRVGLELPGRGRRRAGLVGGLGPRTDVVASPLRRAWFFFVFPGHLAPPALVVEGASNLHYFFVFVKVNRGKMDMKIYMSLLIDTKAFFCYTMGTTTGPRKGNKDGKSEPGVPRRHGEELLQPGRGTHHPPRTGGRGRPHPDGFPAHGVRRQDSPRRTRPGRRDALLRARGDADHDALRRGATPPGRAHPWGGYPVRGGVSTYLPRLPARGRPQPRADRDVGV